MDHNANDKRRGVVPQVSVYGRTSIVAPNRTCGSGGALQHILAAHHHRRNQKQKEGQGEGLLTT